MYDDDDFDDDEQPDADIFKTVAPWDPEGRRPTKADAELPRLPGVEGEKFRGRHHRRKQE